MRKAAIRDYNASLEDRLVMTATANGARSRVYGRVRNSDGVIFKGTHGDKSELYTLVIALAGHEIDAVEKIYFGDVPVDLDPDGVAGVPGFWVATPPFLQQPKLTGSATISTSGGAGSVVLPYTPIPESVTVWQPSAEGDMAVARTVSGTTVSVSGVGDGTYNVSYQYIAYWPRAHIRMYLGKPGQNIGLDLSPSFPELLTAADRFDGIAALVVRLQYDSDAFPSGVPNISAVIRGAKVYDPRTGLTQWTENPALIARDWALYQNGGGCLPSEIVESSFIAAANACDVETTFNTTAGTETRKLYECGIVAKLDFNPNETFEEMVESMAGKWGWSGGRLSVVAGVYRGPVAAIDETWLTESDDIAIVKDAPRTDVVNVFRPTIASADGYVNGVTGPVTAIAYTATPLPEVRSDAYIAADGQELTREISLAGVTRNVHAQHICGVMLRDARDGLIVQLPCNMKAWQLELFDVVTLTLPHFGFQAKLFEIIGWRFSVDKGVMLTLKETAASIYNPASGLSVLNAAENTTLPLPWSVPGVFGVFATSGVSILEDKSHQTRTKVTWTAVNSESVRQSGRIEIQYTDTPSAFGPDVDWPSRMEEGTATSSIIPGLLAGHLYFFRVRAINTLGVRGVWSTQVSHVVANPPPVDTDQIAPEAATEILSASVASTSWTTPTADPRGTLVKSLSNVVCVNPYDTPVTLEISAFTNVTIPVDGASGATPGFRFDILTTGGARLAGFLGQLAYLYPGTGTTSFPVSIVWQYVLAANSTVVVDFFVNGIAAPSGSAASAQNSNLRVAMVKR
jgi:hypothetical protein